MTSAPVTPAACWQPVGGGSAVHALKASMLGALCSIELRPSKETRRQFTRFIEQVHAHIGGLTEDTLHEKTLTWATKRQNHYKLEKTGLRNSLARGSAGPEALECTGCDTQQHTERGGRGWLSTNIFSSPARSRRDLGVHLLNLWLRRENAKEADKLKHSTRKKGRLGSALGRDLVGSGHTVIHQQPGRKTTGQN